MSHTDRIVVLVDMDCFYCQVEEKLNPSLKGKPVAVVQYNAWRGGGIIAVNYAARERGVTRHIRGEEAQKKCPEITLVRVPTIRDKADLTKYREAGKTVANVLQTFTPLIERASVDEAYLDITDAVIKRMEDSSKQIKLENIKNTFVIGCDTMDFLYNLYEGSLHIESNLRLAYGALIAEEIRAAVYERTGYTCSAGIAHNKILAKLVCGMNKPNKQTLIPQDNVMEFYRNLPIQKIRSLGGKFGQTLSNDLGITCMGELLKFTEKELQNRYDEKTGSWLYNIARGINNDPVTTRMVSKSIGCCKKFPGKSALIEPSSVMHWLNEFAAEMVQRLDQDMKENNRKAKQMVVSYSQEIKGEDVHSSRSCMLNSCDPEKIAVQAFEVVKKNCLKPTTGTFCIKFLGISAGKFEDCRNLNEITSFFKPKTNECNAHQTPELSLNENTKEEARANFSECNEKAKSTGLILSDADPVRDEKETRRDSSDGDSITNELPEDSKNEEERKESFFVRYFENFKRQSDENSAPRDFDTSLALTEFDSENDPQTTDAEESNNHEKAIEICTECNKKINTHEMVSHMDYHFAIKMVREESELYKTERRQTQQQSTKKSSRKRKCVASENSIRSFFKQEPTETNADTHDCPECSKKINPAHLQSHLDYHVAKKLHMEINPMKSSAPSGLKAKSERTNGSASIVNRFFKKS